MRRRFVTLDVVTHRRVAGNPLAPVLDAEDLDCASASKADPTPSAYQGLDFPYEFAVSVGSQSAPMRTLPCCSFS